MHRRRATCGMCRVPRTQRVPAPDALPRECCKRVSCDEHALDRRGSPRTTASPRRVGWMLASRDLSSAQQIRRVCASAALAPCSPSVGTMVLQVATNTAHRVTSGGRGPCMMAAFTASRHFMATLGAPWPLRARRNGNCNPTRVASSTRWRWRAVALSTNSLLEDRARVQHIMRGCAPTRMSEAAASSLTAAHMINWANDANSWNKSQRPEPRQETNNHWILPVSMCEKRSRTTCSRFHRLHSESTLACGRDCGAARSSRAAHSSLSTRSQKENAFADNAPAESP